MAGQQRLGSLLVELGFIDEGQLESALEEQQRSGRRLGRILVKAGVITEDRLVHALSRQLGIETCDPLMTNVHERVLQLIPVELAFRFRVLPVALRREDTGEVVFVATADPLNKEALAAIRQANGSRRVRWLLSGETEIELALARHYGAPPKIRSAQPTPIPEGMPVIMGTAVSAPSGDIAPNQPPPSAPPPVRPAPSPAPPIEPPALASADLTPLEDDEVEEVEIEDVPPEVDDPLSGIDSMEIPEDDLPPIDVPPEFLTSPDAALRMIEAESPDPGSDLPELSGSLVSGHFESDISDLSDFSNLSDSPVLTDNVPPSREPFEPPPPNGQGGQPVPSSPPVAPGMSWGDLVGGEGELVPEPTDIETPMPIAPEMVGTSHIPEPEPIDEPIPEPDPPQPIIDDLAQATAHALTHEAPPESVDIDIDEDPTELGDEVAIEEVAIEEVAIEDVGAQTIADTPLDELPDATDDAIPSSDLEAVPIAEIVDHDTEIEVSDEVPRLTPAEAFRGMMLQFIDDGTLDESPERVLRVLVAVLENEGLLDEARLARALALTQNEDE